MKNNWKLIELNVNETKTNKFELYNLANDPGEQKNVLSANQTKYNELKKIMDGGRVSNHLWNFTKLESIPGLDIIDVMDARASSCQGASNDISLSYDRSFSTIYHSKFDEKTFPVILDYSFIPAQIKTIIYHTRNDNSQNGNFKEFELWGLPNSASEYVKVESYDFKGANGTHRIDFEGESARIMENVKALRFVVKSGVGNLASCAEMVFYAEKETPTPVVDKENRLQLVVQDRTIFINGVEGGEAFELYSYMGEKLKTKTPLIPGIYLVKVGETVSKVLIR